MAPLAGSHGRWNHGGGGETGRDHVMRERGRKWGGAVLLFYNNPLMQKGTGVSGELH
jgi:hypothetical protein